jgi:uncharacterized membrane protein YcaP (DUF421 family)
LFSTAIQTFIIYWFVILGLKLVGRRALGELGPEDLLLIVLVAESLTHSLAIEEAGFFGGLVSVSVLFVIVGIVERWKPLRKRLEGEPAIVLKDGKPVEKTMKRFLIDRLDLEQTARRYGYGTIETFHLMIMEPDGRISGVLKPQYQSVHDIAEAQKVE